MSSWNVYKVFPDFASQWVRPDPFGVRDMGSDGMRDYSRIGLSRMIPNKYHLPILIAATLLLAILSFGGLIVYNGKENESRRLATEAAKLTAAVDAKYNGLIRWKSVQESTRGIIVVFEDMSELFFDTVNVSYRGDLSRADLARARAIVANRSTPITGAEVGAQIDSVNEARAALANAYRNKADFLAMGAPLKSALETMEVVEASNLEAAAQDQSLMDRHTASVQTLVDKIDAFIRIMENSGRFDYDSLNNIKIKLKIAVTSYNVTRAAYIEQAAVYNGYRGALPNGAGMSGLSVPRETSLSCATCE